METILMIEEEKTVDTIKLALKRAGYRYDCAWDMETAADLLLKRKYSIALVDTAVPGLCADKLAGYMERCQLPVILMTEKRTVYQTAQGDLIRADDYLLKPFENDELLMRIDAVLRRYHQRLTVLEALDVIVDTEKRKVLKNGEVIFLTPKEYDLLVFMMLHQNDVLYRELMFKRVWHEEFMGCSRTLDLHIQRLRRKLGWQRQIKTIYRIGYQLEVS